LASIAGFCLGVLTLFLAFSSARNGGEGLGLDRVRKFLTFGFVVFVLGLISAGVSLLRKENPQWIGALGFTLCLVPSIFLLLGFLLFFRAQAH
jgi:hypothetical protein